MMKTIIVLSKKYLLSAIVGVLLLFIQPADAGQDETNYRNDEYGFKVSYPMDWERKPISGSIRLKVASPREYASNCNISVRYHANMAAKSNKEVMYQYQPDMFAKHLAERFGGADILTAKRARLDGVHAIQHVLDVPYRKNERTYNITLTQIMAFRNGNMYIISCAAPTKHYPKMKRLFKRVEKSFKFTAH